MQVRKVDGGKSKHDNEIKQDKKKTNYNTRTSSVVPTPQASHYGAATASAPVSKRKKGGFGFFKKQASSPVAKEKKDSKVVQREIAKSKVKECEKERSNSRSRAVGRSSSSSSKDAAMPKNLLSTTKSLSACAPPPAPRSGGAPPPPAAAAAPPPAAFPGSPVSSSGIDPYSLPVL